MFLLIARTPFVHAQTGGATIESLAVDLWPDYDQPSVLVLLTGFLSADTPLPATITIPLPEDADLNAVARITETGDLIADITYNETGDGQVTLTTPESRFRIEYYIPYTSDGDERDFGFQWQANIPVTELLVSVQQPVATSELTTDPDAFSVTTRQDGLQYHNLDGVEVPAGESFSMSVSYTRSVDQLSSELLQPSDTAETTTSSQSQTPSAGGLNWQTIVLASGGVALLAVGMWAAFGERFLASRRASAKSRPTPVVSRPKKSKPRVETTKPRPTSPASSPSSVQFCHHCGQNIAPNDRFCKSCGTKLKR
ncbi:MAG: zinc-ribbon domain-containing protein [Candidatus Promineifilaceae bacterium]